MTHRVIVELGGGAGDMFLGAGLVRPAVIRRSFL